MPTDLSSPLMAKLTTLVENSFISKILVNSTTKGFKTLNILTQ